LNRAVAVAEIEGPEAAVRLVDAIGAHSGQVRGYYLFHAIRADFLRRLGRTADAAAAYLAAIETSENTTEREFLQRSYAALS
jgi:RNA polymerase sigma-70 factor (ECF subfamily)